MWTRSGATVFVYTETAAISAAMPECSAFVRRRTECGITQRLGANADIFRIESIKTIERYLASVFAVHDRAACARTALSRQCKMYVVVVGLSGCVGGVF